jgi:hypothetical protein
MEQRNSGFAMIWMIDITRHGNILPTTDFLLARFALVFFFATVTSSQYLF